MTKRLSSLVFLILASFVAHADDAEISVLVGSTGTWEGELYYLDYRSGQRFGIPMRIDAEMTPDSATLVRRLTFTDPDMLVHAVSVATIDRETGELVEAYFRERSAEYLRYEITSVDYVSEADWTAVYEQDGTDDGRPARIRHTMLRSGDVLEARKEVRFLDEGGEFFLRNGIEVKRVGSP